jgi:hypothetical protein
MESEIGIVLREQQALLSLLLNRVALADGAERRLAFEALARALFAHLSVLRSVVLPNAGDTELVLQIAQSGRQMAGIVAKTIVEQQRAGASTDIQKLMTSVLTLLSQERTLCKTAFDTLPRPLQQALAVKAEDEFLRHAGPCEFAEVPAQLEVLR